MSPDAPEQPLRERLERVVRADLRAMSGYHVPDSAGLVKLDAMENPYRLPEPLREELGRRLSEVALNRYPVPTYARLKSTIRERLGVPAGFEVVLGNGSDELIAMLSTATATPGACVLAPVPSFVMYEMSARFAGSRFVGVDLAPGFGLDAAAMLDAISRIPTTRPATCSTTPRSRRSCGRRRAWWCSTRPTTRSPGAPGCRGWPSSTTSS
jgi:histidinol-phosphate/aromatic aminotransferase/cobyric acid decarboxylase-like protein